jgi:hypothetical protein
MLLKRFICLYTYINNIYVTGKGKQSKAKATQNKAKAKQSKRKFCLNNDTFLGVLFCSK